MKRIIIGFLIVLLLTSLSFAGRWEQSHIAIRPSDAEYLTNSSDVDLMNEIVVNDEASLYNILSDVNDFLQPPVEEADLNIANSSADEYVLSYEADTNNFEWKVDQTGSGGSAIILDLADDGTNESTDLSELAITNDIGSVWSESAADKALFDGSSLVYESELSYYTDADIDGTEAAFTGWDKNASDDVVELDGLSDVTGTGTVDYVLKDDGDGTYSFQAESTGTDDQNISGSSFDGTNLTIGIENGTSESVDISSVDTDTNTNLTQEQVDDYVNALLTDTDSVNTLISLTYDDVNNAFDFVVNDDLSLYDNSTSGFLTSEIDGSTSNEINTITGDGATSTSGLGITLSGGTNVTTSVSGDTVTVDATDTDTQLSEATVDSYADNNNYLDLDTYPNADTDSTDDLIASDFTTDGGFLVGTGAGTYTEESGSTARTSLGLGAAAILGTATVTSGETDLSTGGNIYTFCETTQDYLLTSENSDSADDLTDDVIGSLSNTNTGTLAVGELLIYDATSSEFINSTLTGGTNVSITNADGSVTINGDVTELSNLADASISSPAAGEIPIYNATNTQFENSLLTGGNAISITNADASVTLNFDGGASPAGELGNTWASPTLDDGALDDQYIVNDASDTIGAGSGFTWTFDASTGTDPQITFGDGTINVATGALQEGGSSVFTAGDGALTDDDVTDDNVESMTTAGSSGTAPVSDGAGNLTMTDIATQSELDGASSGSPAISNSPADGSSDAVSTIEGTAGESLSFGDIVFSANNAGAHNWYAYEATTAADGHAFARGIVVESGGISSSSTGTIMTEGTIQNTGWSMTSNSDEGSQVYASDTTAGGILTTRPSDTGDVVQALGFVLEENIIYFDPDYTTIVVP